eukprot:985298-Prymnesium_polylepis.1
MTVTTDGHRASIARPSLPANLTGANIHQRRAHQSRAGTASIPIGTARYCYYCAGLEPAVRASHRL